MYKNTQQDQVSAIPLSVRRTVVLIMSSLTLLIIFIPSNSFACGSIYSPKVPWDKSIGTYDQEPINNCDTPFGAAATDLPGFVTLRVEGIEVQQGDSIEIPESGTGSYSLIEQGGSFFYPQIGWFLHTSRGYEFVDTRPSQPTRFDVETLAEEFFSDEIDSKPYVDVVVRKDYEGAEVEDLTLLYQFSAYVEREYVPILPLLLPGTYTLLVVDSEPLLNQSAPRYFWQELLARLLPTAWAAVPSGDYVYTRTFTLKAKPATPVGASSVLFLPGIMGSRLYEESDACGDQIIVRERWLSRDECDQLRLITNLTGSSKFDLYTTEGSVIDEVYLQNLYKTFLSSLEDWKEDQLITDYAAVAYDWRLRLEDILKTRKETATGKIFYDGGIAVTESYLYSVLAELASTSASGKVTIVAHSNGGLLAKYLVDALVNRNDPLAQKIDSLILIGSPQLGTPDDMIGVLHGTEIEFVLKQETTRALLNTMPMAYHLLPGSGYFDLVDSPIISFETGTVTKPWRDTFGQSITTMQGLHDFMSKESGRVRPDVNDLSQPAVVDEFLLDYAEISDITQKNWTPPEDMQVYQVAGTGLETLFGLTYFTDRACIARVLFVCTTYSDKLGYRVNMALDGDGTVVVPSALALGGENIHNWWLNLKSYNRVNQNRQHKDLLEVPDVINFVKDRISSKEEFQYEYLTDETPVLPKEDRLSFQLHSPLDMSVVSEEGMVVSSTSDAIEGATYKRYGEVQYISLPKTVRNPTLRLTGVSTGSFTLEVSEETAGIADERLVFSAIPSSTSTQVTLPVTVVLTDSLLKVDYDGDGEVDVVRDQDGVVEEVVTYDDLFLAIERLEIKPIFKKSLLKVAKKAEKFYLKSSEKDKSARLEKLSLRILLQEILWYERWRILSVEQKIQLEGIITKLIN